MASERLPMHPYILIAGGKQRGFGKGARPVDILDRLAVAPWMAAHVPDAERERLREIRPDLFA